MRVVLFIALGGAIGAIGRYGMKAAVSQIFGVSYTFGTVIINVLGSFIFGALIEGSSYWGGLKKELRLFLILALLASFTTFSAFSMDVGMLINRNELFFAGIYIIASTIFSIAAYLTAMTLFRQLFQ